MGTALRYEKRSIRRRDPFTISRGTSLTGEVILVVAEAGGAFGVGAACPNSVTGDTPEGMMKQAPHRVEWDPSSELPDLGLRSPALNAGIETALLDLSSRLRSVPLFRMLGELREEVPSTVSLGIDEDATFMARADEAVALGGRDFKVKADADVRGAVRRIAHLRERYPEAAIYVDANEALDLDGALLLMRECERHGVAAVEQPLARGVDVRALARSSALPLIADESVSRPEDIDGLDGYFGVNVKYVKAGGMRGSMELSRAARDAGMFCMVGCYFEPALSIAAGLHFSLCAQAVRICDLDSSLRLASDFSCGGFSFSEGIMRPLELPGLGVEVEGLH